MAVLLLADAQLDATAKAVTAARKLGGEVHALVAGQGEAAEVAKLQGVDKVLTAPGDAHGLAEPLAALLAALAPNYSHVVAAATSNGKNILARAAGLLDVMIISDAIGVVDAETFERPIYAGAAIQTVKSSDKIKIVTFRTAAFDPAPSTGSAPSEAAAASGAGGGSEWVSDETVKSERPELTAAKIVVSGGRGVGSKENFAIIESLADKLGAAVGASRAAVDSGYAPNDQQVGQTGKVVAPQLYVALGISGAIQHLAGMKDSKVIVAINKDEEAPIFQIADYGLVGDLFDIAPKLEKALG
ncbi:electron transfer flavoprotein subunit alpha/FixB family protein [Neomegalonema sp.]|uniref:electron transfer flavoprotein subunit alpha/FixB family protein n=1 Tax=Neomegalonema sp. TaxID=2039713 RepID=UPI00261EB5FD|nr:electron transfer flavoprotein subunit alpha/FixB family protein [Neomegalonema sp.]MDD2869957.1 electron transfer flavoprotein subunit alpha/FixB family protein [Neomegalonema sp.]